MPVPDYTNYRPRNQYEGRQVLSFKWPSMERDVKTARRVHRAAHSPGPKKGSKSLERPKSQVKQRSKFRIHKQFMMQGDKIKIALDRDDPIKSLIH